MALRRLHIAYIVVPRIIATAKLTINPVIVAVEKVSLVTSTIFLYASER